MPLYAGRLAPLVLFIVLNTANAYGQAATVHKMPAVAHSGRPTLPRAAAHDPDTDGDGLTDYAERHKYFSDPRNPHTGGQAEPDGNWQIRREFTYTITATMQILKPCDPAVMNDDYQDVRVLAQDKNSYTLEITYYPLNTNHAAIGANSHWQHDDAGMTDYLRPTPTENWDAVMRADLLAALKKDGINPDKLTDRQVVEQVSQWAMRRGRHVNSFIGWDIWFPNGKPEVYPALRKDFSEQKQRFGLSERQLVAQEVLGRSMYYGGTHADCTSSATYLATILRAIGIPTRIIFTVPAADTNDSRQTKMLLAAIHHHQTFADIRAGLPGGGGTFANHLYNEVWIAGRWTRLNYDNLGQNIVDNRYFGLMTHIYTTNDLSKTPLAQTWGSRYRGVGYNQPLSSVNPYRLLRVSDHFGKYARIANPELPELTTATVNALYWRDAPNLPISMDAPLLADTKTDFFIGIQEYIKANRRFQRDFLREASWRFLLRAPGHPDVGVTLNGFNVDNGGNGFQAFGASLNAADRAKFISGVEYALVPINAGQKHLWTVAPNVTLRKPTP